MTEPSPPRDGGPPARRTDPVGLAKLERVIADYLATQHPGTRWRIDYDDELPDDGGGGTPPADREPLGEEIRRASGRAKPRRTGS
jgi:hypothetical protein